MEKKEKMIKRFKNRVRNAIKKYIKTGDKTEIILLGFVLKYYYEKGEFTRSEIMQIVKG